MPVEVSSTAGPDGKAARWDRSCAAVHMYEFDAAQLRQDFSLAHPQSVTSIAYETYTRILRAGGIDW